MKRSFRITLLTSWVLFAIATCFAADPIPLPEHPRPDFQRETWLNLNGPWAFRCDAEDAGLAAKWFGSSAGFGQTITVPFPWGSALSGVKDEAPIAWYSRSIEIPSAWSGQRVFLVVGACDWETQGWLDGVALGKHQGGYTPFEFELTPHMKPGQSQRISLRVDDVARKFKLEGKQGYGNARGIWQTVYLEARSKVHLKSIHFTPDIDQGRVGVSATFSDPAPDATELKLTFSSGDLPALSHPVQSGARQVDFQVPIPKPHLWSLDDPFLYDAIASLKAGGQEDRLSTYFGMRKISTVKLPGAGFPYIALNNQPIYLQLTLDQSYHPEGFYTFPSDQFMRDEILRSRRIGLNANRLHVKVDVPRKLYWADRLGLLIMADVPNSWGEPDAAMRQEIEQTFRSMVERDFNHPAIFAWVPFNETWGLFSGKDKDRKYLPETQEWVASVYRLGKQLDPSRLTEDNSACNYDHVQTDINSWHAYLPGYEWREHLDKVTQDTAMGSKWNFIGGRPQGEQPLLNSECGNVWGYEGSTGDCDWSWDYHIMMNEFRRHPKICGWLYTEHHDVINEWNGYYRFDRGEKDTGLEDIVTGMSIRDLHSPFYLSTGSELCREAKPREEVSVPVWASFMADNAPSESLRIRATVYGWDSLGRRQWIGTSSESVKFKPWMSEELAPMRFNMPDFRSLVVVALALEDASGAVLHRNFTTFLVGDGAAPRSEEVQIADSRARLVRFSPDSFSSTKWSLKQWNVLGGLKVNGAGSGYFEYRLPWPEKLELDRIAGASLVFEASAKQLFGKDREGAAKQEGDYMRGKGTSDPSLNPNAYPMTDSTKFPSAVTISVAGHGCGVIDLGDDPADHRGILSWHAQPHDRKLREAGSYGQLVQVSIPAKALAEAAAAKELIIRMEVPPGLPGGLAIYGERFGRYPLDPTLVFSLK